MLKNNYVLTFILQVIKPFKFFLILQAFVSFYWALDLCLRPYLLKILLDRIQTTAPMHAWQNLLVPGLLYVALLIVLLISYRLSDFVWIKLNAPLKRHIGMIAMEKMLHQSQSFFHNNFAGSLSNKIKDTMSGIPDLVRLYLNTFLSNFFIVCASIITVWTINSFFVLALCCWVTIFIGGSILLSCHARVLSYQAAEQRSHVVGNIVDILNNSMIVRLFTTRSFELQRLLKILNRWVHTNQSRDWYFLYMNGLLSLSLIVYQIFCIIFLIYGFSQGTITAGDFVLIFTLNTSINHILWKLSEEITKVADLYGTISQGIRITLEPIEIGNSPKAQPLQITQGSILFDRVHFNYKGTAPLFQDKSLFIPGGQKVGLVGYSGSGKSTFVKLILRLYPISEGTIAIDNQNIKDVTQDSLHSSIGVIPQDPILFNRSLMENIRYGNLSATDAEVIQAAKNAHAHEFIIEQPEGYATIVGERGIKISGGQRQRIALARIFLKNAPLLILDEVTSQLDSVTERFIQDSLQKLMHNKTTLVIAHRLSTLLAMDRILVFEQGKIVEDGTHDELLTKNGLYTALWNAQVCGFLPNAKN